MVRTFQVLLALSMAFVALVTPARGDFEDCTPARSLYLDLPQPVAKSTAVVFGSATYGEILGAYGRGDFFAEYVLSAPCAGIYQVNLRYAAAYPRPLSISVNGTEFPGQVATRATGGWTFNFQRRFEEPATIRLKQGPNSLRIASHDGEWPHLSEFELVLSSQRDDITGVWRTSVDPNDLYSFYQSNGQVTGVLVNARFSHLLKGVYTTGLEIRGAYEFRINRLTGCATRMDFKIRMKSPDAFQLKWLGLDAKCDIAQGQESPWIDFQRVL